MDYTSEFEELLVSKFNRRMCTAELGTFDIFNFFNDKNDIFAFFIKLIWRGIDFLNRNGAEIG